MKILVPVDGSEICKATLDWASKAFSKEDTEFYILTVLSDPMIAEYKLEDAIQELKNTRAQLEAAGHRVAKAEYLVGDPVQRICQFAEEEAADQVLMGSHGRTGLMKVLLGSVSQGVLAQCKRPVFIYRAALKTFSGKA